MRVLRAVGGGVLWWAALLGVYLLLVAKLAWPEAIAGSACAVLGATGATVVVWVGGSRYRGRLSWLVHLVRLPWSVLRDCGLLALALGRSATVVGEFRTIPFDPGGDDPMSAARRALVTAGVSLAPNTYVVSVDRERNLLLVHQLVPSAQPPRGGDRKWPL